MLRKYSKTRKKARKTFYHAGNDWATTPTVFFQQYCGLIGYTCKLELDKAKLRTILVLFFRSLMTEYH